jgi:hypothetical protein
LKIEACLKGEHNAMKDKLTLYGKGFREDEMAAEILNRLVIMQILSGTYAEGLTEDE